MDKRSLFIVFLLTAVFLGINWYFETDYQKSLAEWNNQQEVQGQNEKALKTPQKPSEKEREGSRKENGGRKEKGGNEEFYLIENGVQQLLFSNKGGAIAEINLAFADKTHPDSVVKETDYDRLVQKQEPQNDLFPSR